jgi:hypothetical protein
MTLIGFIKGLHKGGGGVAEGFATFEDSTYVFQGGTSTTTRGAIDTIDTLSYAPYSGASANISAYVITNTITGNYDYSLAGGNGDGVDAVLSVPPATTGSFTQTPTTEETFNKDVNIQFHGNRGGTGSYASKATLSVRYD